MDGTCTTHGRVEKHRILVGESEGNRPLGKSRSRWKDNIKMDLIKTRCKSVDWIYLNQDRVQWRALVKTVISLGDP
jgi:hypothetical protein